MLLRQIGDLHSKDITYCQNYFKYGNIVLFHVVVTKDHLAHPTELCFFLMREHRGLNGRLGLTGGVTLYYPPFAIL